jgi:hypothetical protein
MNLDTAICLEGANQNPSSEFKRDPLSTASVSLGILPACEI